jgi:hypothetical protein
LETENEIENAKVKSRKKLRFDCFKFCKIKEQFFEINKVTLLIRISIEPMELKSKEASC